MLDEGQRVSAASQSPAQNGLDAQGKTVLDNGPKQERLGYEVLMSAKICAVGMYLKVTMCSIRQKVASAIVELPVAQESIDISKSSISFLGFLHMLRQELRQVDASL